MKNLGLVLLVAAGAALAFIAFRAEDPTYVPPRIDEDRTVPYELPAAVPAGMELFEYEVSGMCCNGCAEKLYARLVDVEAVEAAAVDSVTGVAQVFVSEAGAADAVLATLRWDKYEATPIE